ncbi:hypothetical protein [Haloarchaeobius sp. HME9146]|uniref:DUF7544 domain-containing protein n=1 Tax=Haloarchaeobius sp. HME9146 TaxID=2978732 RepID=UPI0021C08EF6|nr:hypothetical protein [Haloarchaeobius sp. HME9146]MCT9098490.1 hypothetical protein [Haloarchaeobius sp. HME9146]
MPLHAVEDLDDAYTVTRSFLGSLGRSDWLKLALVVLFVGGPGANFASFQYSVPANSDGGGVPPVDVGQLTVPDIWLIAALVAAVAAFVVALLLVGSIMEFVFVESLRQETVAIRRYWREHWRAGLGLFGFRLVLGLLVFGSVALFAGLFVLTMLGGGPPRSVFAVFAVALVLVPLFLVLAVIVGVVNGFTTVFVVPIMLVEEVGVLAGWRRLWGTIPANWTQYLAYAVAGAILSMVGGAVVGIVAGVAALVLLVPFGALFGGGFLLFSAVEALGILVMAVAAVLFVVCLVAVAAVVQVPVQTYLRYYAMLVLGDVAPDLDPVPEQRSAVRADDEEGDGGSGAGEFDESDGVGGADETDTHRQ